MIVVLVIMACVSLLVVPPLAFAVYGGPVEPILPIRLPFVDETTRNGLIVQQLVHFIWLACGGCGLIGSDVPFIMLTLYSWPLADVFIDHVNVLNKMVLTPRVANSKEMKVYLRNIVLLHQELCE